MATSKHTSAQGLPKPCANCHGSTRMVAEKELLPGLSKWRDQQCYGCHQQFTDILRNKPGSKLYWLLPLTETKRKAFAKAGFSYLNAPQDIGVTRSGLRRISPKDLMAYTKNPVWHDAGASSQQMMAFPRMNEQKQSQILNALYSGAARSDSEPESSGAENQQRGADLWAQTCGACHGAKESAAPSPLKLSFYTAEWLRAYATGQVGIETRTMPKLALTKDDAAAIKKHLVAQREATIAKLDREAGELKPPKPAGQEVSDDEIGYVWRKFLREGHCVHCHSGEQPAATAFSATNAGLYKYVTTKDPWEIWRRLKTRPLEQKAGITATKPGMPMTKEPVDNETLTTIERWLSAGCQTSQRKKLC